MHFISVQIVRFVDSHQPGWVECLLVDAERRRHIIVEKVVLNGKKPDGSGPEFKFFLIMNSSKDKIFCSALISIL